MSKGKKSVGIVKGQVKFGEGGVKIAALASQLAPGATVLGPLDLKVKSL